MFMLLTWNAVSLCFAWKSCSCLASLVYRFAHLSLRSEIVLTSHFSESIMKRATNVSRENLSSLGVCAGKFTKAGKFRLQITALEMIAPLAKYKVWLKAQGEMPWLYGNHVVKGRRGYVRDDACAVRHACMSI